MNNKLGIGNDNKSAKAIISDQTIELSNKTSISNNKKFDFDTIYAVPILYLPTSLLLFQATSILRAKRS